MSGRKNFVAGEILTAADVNSFLMDQSVMVFDDSPARGSAIPTPSEGMVTYLKSDDQVTVFDGSAFKPVGGLVAVKSALKTDIESFTSVAASGNVTVTGLSVTHEVQDPANRLIISAFFGAASVNNQFGNVGIAVHDGSGLIVIGDAAGSRTRVTAGGFVHGFTGGNQALVVGMPSVTFVHTPGAGSKTYTVRAINVTSSAQTLNINRAQSDNDDGSRPRSVSSLVIQEVAV